MIMGERIAEEIILCNSTLMSCHGLKMIEPHTCHACPSSSQFKDHGPTAEACCSAFNNPNFANLRIRLRHAPFSGVMEINHVLDPCDIEHGKQTLSQACLVLSDRQRPELLHRHLPSANKYMSSASSYVSGCGCNRAMKIVDCCMCTKFRRLLTMR